MREYYIISYTMYYVAVIAPTGTRNTATEKLHNITEQPNHIT
jgi:hypothetical protein